MPGELPGDAATGALSNTQDGGQAILSELVVCSLEAWNDVWRRNQFFVDALLRRNLQLPCAVRRAAADLLSDLRSRSVPTLPRLRSISYGGRLRVFRPLKPLPRKAGPLADGILLAQVRLAARAVGFKRPTLWINDVTYAPLIERQGGRHSTM